MAASISTHVLDTAQGRPLRGVRVSLYRGTELVGRAETDADGRVKELARDLASGPYRILFDVKGVFYEEFAVQVRIDDGHYHVPLLVSPFSCVTYRGS
ncbi:MAG: hydroxyisourate hydrolase [Actinobacteria bacterium]|nr:hydroxyisourate hydrolase [Actinomycetota bacterium]